MHYVPAHKDFDCQECNHTRKAHAQFWYLADSLKQSSQYRYIGQPLVEAGTSRKAVLVLYCPYNRYCGLPPPSIVRRSESIVDAGRREEEGRWTGCRTAWAQRSPSPTRRRRSRVLPSLHSPAAPAMDTATSHSCPAAAYSSQRPGQVRPQNPRISRHARIRPGIRACGVRFAFTLAVSRACRVVAQRAPEL